MNKVIFRLEGILQLFIGIPAVVFGLLLIIDPSGGKIGLPIELIFNSPFKDYLIPGLLLFSVNGIGNVLSSVLSFKKSRYSGYTGAFFGTALVIWIIVQTVLVGFHWLQPAYLILGIIELILGIAIYKQTN